MDTTTIAPTRIQGIAVIVPSSCGSSSSPSPSPVGAAGGRLYVTSWVVFTGSPSTSILITSVAGYIGLVFGVGILELISPYMQSDFFSNPEADFQIAVSATILLIVSGALAGFFPAKKAAAIKK